MDGGDSAGGSSGLAKLIDQHGEAILADFQSFYGLSLVDVMRPGSGYSPRRVLVLLRQLPMESRTIAALRGGDHFFGWGPDRYLSAAIVDAINQNTFAFISANSKKKPKPPEPVERPESKTKKQQSKSNANPFAVMAASKIAAVRKARGG